MKPHPMKLNEAQNTTTFSPRRICNEELNKEECDFDCNDCCSYSTNVNGESYSRPIEEEQKRWYDEKVVK